MCEHIFTFLLVTVDKAVQVYFTSTPRVIGSSAVCSGAIFSTLVAFGRTNPELSEDEPSRAYWSPSSHLVWVKYRTRQG
jgi:hypothetical protein